MFKTINKFHAWYDKVKEPWRFLLLMILAAPTISMPLFVGNPFVICVMGAWTIALIITRFMHVTRVK